MIDTTSTNNLDANADFIAFDLGDVEEEEILVSTDEKKSLLQKAKSLGQSLRDKLGKGEKRKREAQERDDDAAVVDYSNTSPWIADKNYADEKEAVNILHREIQDFVAYISPTPMEHATRQYVINRIRNVITKHWKDTQVSIFGSFDTHLYLPTRHNSIFTIWELTRFSDIDIVVLSNGTRVYETLRDLREMANKLTREGIAREMQVIAKASVPIIKFIERQTKLRVDISFNKPSGLVSAAVVKEFLTKYPAARWLIVIVKHFLSMRGMNEVYSGGLGSIYGLLIIVNGQLHPQIASERIQPHNNLGVLLIEFLELYGKKFNYDSVGISIDGKGSYFSKVDIGWIRPNQPYLLSIRDPSDATNDIAKSSHQILKVRSTFSAGYDLLLEEVYLIHDRIPDIRRNRRSRYIAGSISLLKSILAVNRDIYKARDHIAQLWARGEIKEMPFLVDDIPYTPPLRKPQNRAVEFVAVSTDGESDHEDSRPKQKQRKDLTKKAVKPVVKKPNSQVALENSAPAPKKNDSRALSAEPSQRQRKNASKGPSKITSRPPSTEPRACIDKPSNSTQTSSEPAKRKRVKSEKGKSKKSYQSNALPPVQEVCVINSSPDSNSNQAHPTKQSMDEDSRYGAIDKLGKKSDPIVLD
ncbi:Poly(A) RNA polymerase cid14 [Neolecta irregularis DAH-3]|uniref:polynucleotide adenylyltransferase n=1 Tax=Neolecta irregularis (strain DAH-3) TaxID=1198029 RepID=A0A1U7LMK6_NEOID|nr:Poly(A) RNA polymerase cid14 [Neolecta irregularis DAH-3]|eukprot:OLL23900.1 Poly(A) RNA polymerase cid14 [Neolecta irregularis DAH-3]